jgi:hypothetical protein
MVKIKISANDFGLPEDENSRILGDRIRLPEFEIVSTPTFRMADLMRRYPHVIERERILQERLDDPNT